MNTKLNHAQNWIELAHRVGWSVSVLAKLCNVSVRSLELHFLKANGLSPKAWMIEQRMQLALELLRDGMSVKEVAVYLNYKYAHHLSRDFERRFGFYPTQTDSGYSKSKLRILV